MMQRKDYESLCGEWQFSFDDQLTDNPSFDRTIIVPYSYESSASGIGDTRVHSCVWYKRTFQVKPHHGSILLHFEGIDYHAIIYINDVLCGEHVGGFTSFVIDATDYVHSGDNTIKIKVLDSLSKSQLRGKQRARETSYECWYVQTTGIWKPVWLEYAGSSYIESIDYSAEINGHVAIKVSLNKPAKLAMEVRDGDKKIYREEAQTSEKMHSFSFEIQSPKLWNAEHPDLYSTCFRVFGESQDTVESYFGISEIRAKEAGIFINGEREYQQMILYQGYWSETMLSAPDDIALEKDIDMIKALGFNGVRVHQKIENAVFYYLCDKKGLYVWGEIPSAYEFTEKMCSEFTRDAKGIFHQLKNHVCVTTWLLFNETWGVEAINNDKEQQKFVEEIAAYIKSKDKRPVITNDGWYHLDSDILSLHEYEQDAKVFAQEYADKDRVVSSKIINGNHYGKAFAEGYSYTSQPIFISEYGGIALDGRRGWGYGENAHSVDQYEKRLKTIVETVESLTYVSGCCYTQFNDTQQEVNGLLNEDRVPKLPAKRLHAIFSRGQVRRR